VGAGTRPAPDETSGLSAIEAIENVGEAGLGLAIAKRILELHGSSLEAQSRVNVGTTFVFQVVPLATSS